LRQLAQAVADCGEQIQLEEQGAVSDLPSLTISVDGTPTGIAFHGAPNGHEFTSFVVAIMNAAGKGRLPDAGIQSRVRSLNGPISLRTIVSLECTNCPDVIQALNQMAVIHQDFSHTMVDGALIPGELKRRGIQGVPAVIDGEEIIHVGKADLGSLLDLLEQRFGQQAAEPVEPQVHEMDVAVVGGGPAGAAAAIYSARKGLRTALVAGRIGGQVSDTLGIENLISTPATKGPILADDLRQSMEAAGVIILDNRLVASVDDGNRKRLGLKGGEVVTAGQVVIATGAKWRELGVPGEREHIGQGVAFCPHCEGPFFKGRPVAVVGGGNSGVEAAIDLAGICSQVTVVEFGDELRADAVLQRKLASLPNVSVLTSAKTTEILGDGSAVHALQYEDRSTGALRELAVEGVFVQIGLVPNSAAFAKLVDTNRAGEIVVDDHGRTSQPGIYAAGDVTTVPYKQIVIAMGDGAKVALAAFEDRMRA
jgi:alkyl hydroperoxide reductase subunit F